MKRTLKRIEQNIYYIKDGVRVHGAPPTVCGNLAYISGDLSDIRGDLSGVSGNLSGVSGNLTDISGDLTDISGNIDDCEITDQEREAGISVEDLIA